MAAKFYAAQDGKAMIQVVIVRGKKEIKINVENNNVWHEILLDAERAAGLRKFLEENNWK